MGKGRVEKELRKENVQDINIPLALCNYEKTSVAKQLPRSGRPRKLTSRDESCIFRKVRINLTKSYRQLTSDF
ncbi:hypothetical protein BpHYR1_045192 [Brachionus plicatilis]|uniref:Uncharacterized protein n=1 Tax=Brachionus plicatilis TaxID=10195 RepID=A0A3M7PKV1_BRAPC|nr:hypothetical protein BpHYR1_045192 [Brachionus plicatilis]